MIRRVFLMVLDSYGIGEAPDAADFGDFGVSTLASIAGSDAFDCPNLTRLGLFAIDGASCGRPRTGPAVGSYGRLRELSRGKDTTIGHWELAGIVSTKAMPTFPHGFPVEFMAAYESAVGRACLCNLPYSGTKVLSDYGGRHMADGSLIVYTSADSVFQVAAHERIVPVEELYRCCRIARAMLTGELAVGRVIARPFEGDAESGFRRTPRRHDFSLSPPAETMLDLLRASGREVISVGKIYDIFNGAGLTESNPTAGNADGMQTALRMQRRDFEGLCFINLVDFDMLYGHRRDVTGYAAASTEFDRFLSAFLPGMREDDLLILTADHGCDPAYTRTTDHTREYVPFLLYGKRVQEDVNLGTLPGFSTVAATICQAMNVEAHFPSPDVWDAIAKEPSAG